MYYLTLLSPAIYLARCEEYYEEEYEFEDDVDKYVLSVSCL
jgi:hypothetical protein